jgi:hypothetical protein
MCAWCKKVRTQDGTWIEVESYLAHATATATTHGICPECAAALMAQAGAPDTACSKPRV